jgi:hypothetical protein
MKKFFVDKFCDILDFLANKSVRFLTVRQDTVYDYTILCFRAYLLSVSALISNNYYDKGTEFELSVTDAFRRYFNYL